MRAFVLDFDGGRTEIDSDRALAASHETPVVLEGALVELGYLERFRELYLDEIAAMTSPAFAADLRSRGLEHLHEALDADRVAALIKPVEARARGLEVPWCRAAVDTATSPPRPHYFICARTFVRAMIPYADAQRSPGVMRAGHLFGHVLPSDVHRDFWLSHPRNSRSLWSAIGPVRAGNSLVLHEGTDDEPGRSISPALAAGDTLLFNSDCLHGSVRNETDETRVVVGHRITVGRRLAFGPGSHWRPWYDASLVESPLRPLATVQSRLSRAAWRRWRARRAFARQQRALVSDGAS